MAAENSASRSPPKASPGPASPQEQDLSRTRITQSFGGKDPSWFRQTTERETSSPANRRSRGDVSPSGVDSVSGRRQLPGMAADSISADKQMEGNSPVEGGHSKSPSRSSSVRGSARWSNQFSNTSTSLSGFSRQQEHRSPTHSLDTYKIPPPLSENTSSLFDEDDSFNSGKSLAMSPSQERISAVQAERSTSPTKGMGGFVQSAMLKRNESVNKRWSAQTYTGLSRQNSFMGNSNTQKSNEGSPLVSRSNSIEQTSAALDRKDSLSRLTSTINDFPKSADPRDDVFVKPSIPSHSRSKSVLSNASSATAADKDEVGSTSRPSSPSKRWSPVKASWLENALKKPSDSPKPMASLPSQQPSWMAEISKTKSQRSSVDMGSATRHQKGGSSDLKLPQSRSTSAFPADISEKGENEEEVKKVRDAILEQKSPTKDAPEREDEKVDAKMPERKGSKDGLPANHESKSSPPLLKFQKSPVSHKPPESENPSKKLTTISNATGSTLSSNLHLNRTIVPSSTLRSDIAPLPKTTETESGPTTNFRSVLKPRQPPTTSVQPENKEFLNAIGNLKRTQTKNYVAPDEFKNNILRGKAALNVTGGPKKSERVDEFKESILKRKEAMKVKAEAEKLAGGNGLPKEGLKAAKEEEIPEAAAMRNALGKGINTVGAGAGAGIVASRMMGVTGTRVESGKGESSIKPEQVETTNVVAKKFVNSSETDQKPEPLQPKAVIGEPPVPSSFSLPKKMGEIADKEPSNIIPKPLKSKIPNSLSSAAAAAAATTDVNRKIDDKSTLNESQMPEKDQKPSIAGTVDTKGGTSKQIESLPLKGFSRDKIEASKSSPSKEELSKTSASISESTFNLGLRGLKSTPLQKMPVEDKTSSPGKAVASPLSSSSSKLADRLNPALANLIAKGAAQQNASDSDLSQKMAIASSKETIGDLKGSESKELTHMTRGRVKGPKRKPPSVTAKSTRDTELKPENLSSNPVIAESEDKKDLANDSASTSPKDEGAANTSSLLQSEASTTPQSSLNDFQSPRNAKLNVDEANESNHGTSSPTASQSDNYATQPHQNMPTRKSVTLSQTPHISPLKEAGSRAASRSPSPRSRAFQVHSPTSPLATQQYISSTEGLGISSMPSPTSKNPSRQAPRGPRTLESTGSTSSMTDLDPHARNDLTKAPDSPSRPTVVMAQHTRSRSTSPTKPQESSSPVKKVDNHNFSRSGPGSPRSGGLTGNSTSDNSIFADYFDVTPVTPPHLLDHIDTQAILKSTNTGSVPKIRTIRKQIFEVRGDEKMENLPAQQEHMLYEQEMYVFVHVFASVEGIKSTEVFLWAGSGISESALEDAQPLAKRVAKENGTKLLTSIRQGKETPNFFQALGGILITLRGTRSESRSRYILCGRKHLGHITFDEVDFALGSFCSGFPFLISHGANKLFLWKGVGCNVEELGCTRLISMDLGDGGIGEELSEIEEGHEPQWFFDMFASDTITAPASEKAATTITRKMPRSAEYWKLKANSPRYHVRLFRVKQQQQQSSSQKLSADSQSRFQLGSSWPFRRPSWNSATSSSPPPTPPSKIGTPPTAGSPGQRPISSSSLSQQAKANIVEIEPFNQSDLEPENVYVLDAFFEIYM